MLRVPKKFPLLSDSSSGDEDVRLCRVNTRNTRSQSLSRATRIERVNSGSSSALTAGKRQNKLTDNISDDSSCSEFENTLQKTKRGSLRPLSDYDSGERSSGMSTRSTSSGRVRQEDKTGNSRTGESSDSTSDFNVTRSGRKRYFNIISSSDSSDSGIPVTFKRRNKRMRLESTSSDSSIEHSNNLTLSTVTNRPVSTNTRRRPTVTATVTSDGVRQENGVGRQMPPQNRNNNNNRRNNNSQSATIGVQRSVNTRSAGNNTPAVGIRQFNLRSTNNFSVGEYPNNYSITQSQRTDNNSRSISNNSTSRTNYPRPRRLTRSQNNPITSRNRQDRSTLRVNHWNITDTNAGIITRTQNTLFPSEIFDTSSNDSVYLISPVIFRNNRLPVSSSSSSSPSSTSSDLTSSSDESIPVRNFNRRNRCTPVIIESDEENNTNNVPIYEPGPVESYRNSESSCNVSRPLADVEKKSNKKEKQHSSDSEGESDKCPICLVGFKIQEIGTPKICDHSFCLVCLQEWAKNNNTCPVDRKLFNTIVVRAKVQGQPLREIAVETPDFPRQFIEDMWSTDYLNFIPVVDNFSVYSLSSEGDGPEETCCVCRLSNRSDFMIVCDYCYNVFHMDCVVPPLQWLPAGDWTCPQCLAVEMQSYSDSSSSYSDSVV